MAIYSKKIPVKKIEKKKRYINIASHQGKVKSWTNVKKKSNHAINNKNTKFHFNTQTIF